MILQFKAVVYVMEVTVIQDKLVPVVLVVILNYVHSMNLIQISVNVKVQLIHLIHICGVMQVYNVMNIH